MQHKEHNYFCSNSIKYSAKKRGDNVLEVTEYKTGETEEYGKVTEKTSNTKVESEGMGQLATMI